MFVVYGVSGGTPAAKLRVTRTAFWLGRIAGMWYVSIAGVLAIAALAIWVWRLESAHTAKRLRLAGNSQRVLFKTKAMDAPAPGGGRSRPPRGDQQGFGRRR